MNRWLNQFRLQFEKRVIDVYGLVSFGASGAPTLSSQPTNNKGILSFTRTGVGKYLVTFGTNSSLPVDRYVKLLNIDFRFDTSGTAAAPVAPGMYIVLDAVSSAGQVTIQFNSAGTATDPASGEILHIDFCLGDSTAP